MPGGTSRGQAFTPASGWAVARYEGESVPLPSGRTAMLRKTYSLIEMMRSGAIPNPLRGHVAKMMSEQGAQASLTVNELDQEALVQLMDLMTNQMPFIFVNPRVEIPPEQSKIDELIEAGELPPQTNQMTWAPRSRDEGDEVINVNWITPEDLSYAFTYGQGGVQALESFRDTAESLGVVVDEQEVPVPAESAAVDR